jgi:DNA topoisomerase I
MSTRKSKLLQIGEEFLKSLTGFFKSETAHTGYADCIIRNQEGKILLLHRTYTDDFMNGKWGLPGGHIEEGEEASLAAVRETMEETGLDVNAFPIEVKEKEDCTIHYYGAIVITDAIDKQQIILDNEEHRGYEWVEPSDLGNYDLILDLGSYLPELVAKVPCPVIQRPAFTNPEEKIAVIGGGPTLDEAWEILTKAFDENKITPEQYLIAREKYSNAKKKEAIDVIAKAFDLGMINEEQYMDALKKGGKPAVIGERRNFAGKEYEKTNHGWKPVAKGGSETKKEQPAKKQAPAAGGEHWWSDFKKYQLNCYPLNIPKEHVDVNESGDVNSHWILRWKDPKSGMWKNAYSKEFMNRNAQEKWKRIQNVSAGTIDGIKKKSLKMMANEKAPQSVRDAAAVIAVIAHTGLRRGDKAKLEKSGNRGVSTLLPENVTIEKGVAKLDFIGKSYQENTAEITEPTLVAYLAKRKEEEAGRGQDNLIFHTTDAVIDATFDKVGGEGLKIKDMRTYVATDLARKLLFEDKTPPPPVPDNLPKTKVKKLVQDKLKGVYEKVAEKLNNTPTMAKNSYIHPNIIDFWMKKLDLSFEIKKSESEQPEQEPTLDEIISVYPSSHADIAINEEDEEDCDLFNEPDELVD